MNSKSSLTLSEQFSILPEKLFELLSSPSYLEQWFSPHESIILKVVEHNFIVGGNYKLAYTLPDGTHTELHGEFTKIERPNLIAFTWVWQKPDSHAGIETSVSWLLTAIDNKTELIVSHEGGDSQFNERHKMGWLGSFTRLVTLISKE